MTRKDQAVELATIPPLAMPRLPVLKLGGRVSARIREFITRTAQLNQLVAAFETGFNQRTLTPQRKCQLLTRFIQGLDQLYRDFSDDIRSQKAIKKLVSRHSQPSQQIIQSMFNRGHGAYDDLLNRREFDKQLQQRKHAIAAN